MYRELELPPRVKLEDKTGYEPRFMEAIRREHGLERATEEHWHEVKSVYVSSRAYFNFVPVCYTC